MLAKILAGVVVAFAVTGTGLYFANSKSSCGGCPKSGPSYVSSTLEAPTEPDCCYLGSPCCSSDDCCLKQAAPVVASKASCCEEGKCCDAESAAK
jgi:hypothetical protein